MAGISFSIAWEETHALVRREAALLVPVALALIVLPGLLMDQLLPAATVPGTGPAGAAATFQPAVLASPLNLLVTLFASMVLTLLALRPGISVAEAMRGAVRRYAVAIGASLVLGLAFGLLLVPAAPILAGGQAAVQRLNPGLSLVLAIYMVAVALGLLYALVRLALLNTVATAEPRGVIATIRRAWVLTHGLFWRLFGFIMLFVAASAVASAAVMLGGGTVLIGLGRLIGDAKLGRLLLDMLRGVVNAAFLTYLYLMMARLYVQLTAGLGSNTPGSNRGI